MTNIICTLRTFFITVCRTLTGVTRVYYDHGRLAITSADPVRNAPVLLDA